MSYNLERLEKQLILHEGLKLKPYQCTAKKWTIGVGRNYQEVAFSVAEAKALFGKDKVTFQEAHASLQKSGISKAQALMLLSNDINRCVAQLQAKPFWPALVGDDVRQRVLIDLCFNMGITTLMTFKNTLARVGEGDWKAASNGLYKSKWYGQVGLRGPRVVGMMLSGIDSKDF